MRLLLLLALVLSVAAARAAAHRGSQPLQRALVKQLFSAANGRSYLRGKRDGCDC